MLSKNQPDYGSNISGCLVGLELGCALYVGDWRVINDIDLALTLAEKVLNNSRQLEVTKDWQPSFGATYLFTDETITTNAWIAPLGLLQVYTGFSKDLFQTDCQRYLSFQTSNQSSVKYSMTIAAATCLLARHEIMPEDLMSAILDELMADPFDILRQKLLMAQDYLEERQTLVDNMEAGDLMNIDLWEVDAKNVKRVWAKNDHIILPEDVIAAAFYAFTARKDSFEEALELSFRVEDFCPDLPPLVGVLAGAYHGVEAIAQEWKKNIHDYSLILDTAQRLNESARHHNQ